MGEKDYTFKQEQLARFSKAVGHPARAKILGYLAKNGECYFGELHNEVPIAKSTLSQHLRELKAGGLINDVPEPPRVRYSINRNNWEFAGNLFAEFFCD